ncbi:MAG: hypothetical protein J1F35_05725 [Erysipelotrichales bacterium]|nr:hypothetical protein [Erysipelotrichales bacterium]
MKKNRISTIISEYRKNNPEKNQFAILTNAQIHTKIYGEDSCFLVSKCYKSHAYDDYCDFTYYSNVTGEYFTDNWSTAYGCPNYDKYITSKSFSEAVELGLIDIDIYNSQFNIDIDFIKTRKFNYQYVKGTHPRVKVIKGRKVKKGTTGMFLGIIHEPNYLAWKGNNDVAIIYTNENKIEKVNPYYLEYDTEFSNDLYEFTKNILDEEMKVTNRLRKFDFNKIVKEYFELSENIEAYKKAKEALEEWNKNEEIRKYYPSEKLIAWVKEKFPELNDDEVIEKGIYINKKNGNINR